MTLKELAIPKKSVPVGDTLPAKIIQAGLDKMEEIEADIRAGKDWDNLSIVAVIYRTMTDAA